MRGWLIALALVGAAASAWGQGEPEVYFSSPQAGAAIEGQPWVTVTGRARGPQVEPTTGFDVMLIIDTSGSTATPSRGLRAASAGGAVSAAVSSVFPRRWRGNRFSVRK